MPSWGLMVSEGQAYLAIAPWLSVLPGIAIFLVVAGVQLLSLGATDEGGPDAALSLRPPA